MPSISGRFRTTVFFLLITFLAVSCIPLGQTAQAATHASLASDYKPGELLVRFRQDAESVFTANNYQNAEVREVLESFQLEGGDVIEHVKLESGTSMDRALRMLRSLPGVVYAEPNYLIEAADYTPADPGFLEQWGLDNTGQDGGTGRCDINAARAWALEKGATNPVTVAVIDTGIDLGPPG